MIPETAVDWKAFEYKFSDTPQRAFEELSYYLFCNEFYLNYHHVLIDLKYLYTSHPTYCIFFYIHYLKN